MKRDLTSLQNLTRKEILSILDLTEKLKENKDLYADKLKGKCIGLLFQKPSNRTRVSFEVGTWQLGGNCIYLGPDEINLGVRESTQDVSKTLSRYLDAIIARTNSHDDIVSLTKFADIPVINGLSDLSHPCQGLTDLFSIKEKFGKLQGLTCAYVGDGNNVCHSLLLGCSKVGMNVNVATPIGYEPDAEIVKLAEFSAQTTGAKVTLTHSPQEAVQGAHVIYADVWISMGQEAERQERLDIFKDFQINSELLKEAASNFIFMHCLPAHRGEEVSADVIDGPNAIVFDQAENRLHTQKAILLFLLNNN